MRYIGADPNNYVSFNGELWRIIGVMNNIKGEDGSQTTKIKLIRHESLGSFYFDAKGEGVGSSISSGGSSDWSDSQLMMMLNQSSRIPNDFKLQNNYVLDQNNYKVMKNPGGYYSKAYTYKPNKATPEKFTEEQVSFMINGLKTTFKSLINSVVWNIGDISRVEMYPSDYYIGERGNSVHSGHKTEWIGEIGLIYPSDYGYATAGGTTKSREQCLNTEVFYWTKDTYSDCYQNNWLSHQEHWSNSSSQIWTMVGYGPSYTNNSNSAVCISSPTSNVGTIQGCYTSYKPNKVYPVVYLDSNIKISSGNGTSSNPYILSK